MSEPVLAEHAAIGTPLQWKSPPTVATPPGQRGEYVAPSAYGIVEVVGTWTAGAMVRFRYKTGTGGTCMSPPMEVLAGQPALVPE